MNELVKLDECGQQERSQIMTTLKAFQKKTKDLPIENVWENMHPEVIEYVNRSIDMRKRRRTTK